MHTNSVVRFSLSAVTIFHVAQVVGSGMPLVGEHQAEDRQLIADMVLAKMNQVAEKEANAPQRPTTIQPTQVKHLKAIETELKRAGWMSINPFGVECGSEHSCDCLKTSNNITILWTSPVLGNWRM